MADNTVVTKVVRGTIVILFVSIFAKITSFICETILAAYLGTSYQADAYYMITSIQYVIYPMISVGIWKVFLPVYKELTAKSKNFEKDELANVVITVLTIVSVLVVTFMIVFGDRIVGSVAPGFGEETKNLCIQLIKISSPMYIFIVAAAVYASMLQCHDRFLGSQIREVVSNIPTIVVAIFFYSKYGIKSLAYALVMGGVLRLLIELPFVNWGYRYKPSLNLKVQYLGVVLKRMPSALLSESVVQINTLVDKMMASGLPTGAISSLNYGSKLNNVLSGMFSSAIATSLYPQIVELQTLGKKTELNQLITKIFAIFVMAMAPLTVACVLFGNDLVQVVYARGAFDRSAVQLTTGVFVGYSVGMFFAATNTILMNLFYASGDTKTPLKICIVNLLINVVCNLILIGKYGAAGLAIASSISIILTFIIRVYLLKGKLRIQWEILLPAIYKIIPMSILSCCLPFFLLNKGIINSVYLRLLLSSLSGVVIYFWGLKLLKLKELHDLVILLKRIPLYSRARNFFHK